MSLEKFKTQVLLLHSEQRTLDSLSKGFSDSYTVHCATSGSEALTTLGEVPIHVLVSAQELPGMSGLEALREAKKRSPETIGILLAEKAGNDVEALVGEKDMFQVVRGEVTPESLRHLIEDATQQARLLTLAESANDTAAHPDEPVSEHIVMETSENGSTIISDGTGRMPALSPGKVSAQANLGARSIDVLVLTQDEEFLQTVRKSSHGTHDVLHANTISQADDALQERKVGVAVIDAAMVGGNVEQATLHLRKTTSRLVSIVAGRRDDGEMLMDLINRGKVYRFLLKPVSPGRARLAIEASVKHHLEAPDSAFQSIGGAEAAPPKTAPKGVAKPPATPAGKTTPDRGSKPRSPATSRPAPEKKPAPLIAKRDDEPRSVLPDIEIEPRSEAPPIAKGPTAPVADGLGDAFGDDSGFTATITGMFETVGKKFSAKPDGESDEQAADDQPPLPDAPPKTTSGSGTVFADSKVLGISGIALLVVAGIGWWLFGGDPEPAAENLTAERPAAVAPAPAEADAVPPTDPVVDLDDLLAAARAADAEGRVFNPPRDNAIELYLAAAAAVPGNAQLETEFAAAIERALGMAESALLARRIEETADALQRVALADPGNPRLPFLSAQLAQVQLREQLEFARAAIRETRFEEATLALDAARELAVADSSDIETVADELQLALGTQRVATILTDAARQLEAGNLIAPANDNARYYYELALGIDPDNAAARQGLIAVASKLVLQTRASIDAGDFAAAEDLLAEARELDSQSVELADAESALVATRDRLEQERLAAERAAIEKAAAEKAAAERAEAERLAAAERAEEARRLAAEREAAERAEAERLAAEQAAAKRAEAERLAAERAEAERLATVRAAAERAEAERLAAERAQAQRAAAEALAVDAAPERAEPVAEPAPARARTVEPPAAQAAETKPASEPVRREVPPPAAAATRPATRPATQVPSDAPAAKPQGEPAAAQPAADVMVPISSLTRTRYVAPKYPRAAERRSLSGWVDVVFTIDIDGSVSDVDVRDSTPGDTFVSAAVNAVEDWEFEPVFENGIAVEKRSAVRMMFAIE